MKNLKFIHITKNAGTSIENIGYKNKILWGRYDPNYMNINIKNSFLEKWHATGYLNSNYDYFCVVRNPYDRIISEFHCKYSNPHILKIEWTTESFNKFVQDKILNSMKLLQKDSHEGGHYCPQYCYVVNKDVTIHVIKYENINKEFDDIMKLYNIKLSFDQHDNKSCKKKFTALNFDKQTIELINIFYDKDFELFNYPKIIM